jgi:hypothetical protein
MFSNQPKSGMDRLGSYGLFNGSKSSRIRIFEQCFSRTKEKAEPFLSREQLERKSR